MWGRSLLDFISQRVDFVGIQMKAKPGYIRSPKLWTLSLIRIELLKFLRCLDEGYAYIIGWREYTPSSIPSNKHFNCSESFPLFFLFFSFFSRIFSDSSEQIWRQRKSDFDRRMNTQKKAASQNSECFLCLQKCQP